MEQKKSEKELLKIIREGKPGTSMPSWKGELSDQYIQDVLAFLRGFDG
jgi:mono/diheme cytochrome c family protein